MKSHHVPHKEVTAQNIDKTKGRPPKPRQTEKSPDQNIDKPKRRQNKASTIQQRRHTKTSIDQNVDRLRRRQAKTSTGETRCFHFSALYVTVKSEHIYYWWDELSISVPKNEVCASWNLGNYFASLISLSRFTKCLTSTKDLSLHFLIEIADASK